MPDQTALVPRKTDIPVVRSGLAITTLSELSRLCEAGLKSGLAPDGMKRQDTLLIVALAGMERYGWGPISSWQRLTVVNGRIGMYGETAIALCRESPAFEYLRDNWEDLEPITTPTDDTAAKVWCKRKGDPDEVYRSFSVADAKRAGLWKKQTYVAYWKDMLYWRAVARATKVAFADVLQGIGIAEAAEPIQAEATIQSGDVIPPADLDAVGDQIAEEDTIEATVEPAGIDKLPPAPGEDAEYTVDHEAAGDAGQREAAAGANGTTSDPYQPLTASFENYEAALADASSCPQVDRIRDDFLKQPLTGDDVGVAQVKAHACKAAIKASHGKKDQGELFPKGPPPKG